MVIKGQYNSIKIYIGNIREEERKTPPALKGNKGMLGEYYSYFCIARRTGVRLISTSNTFSFSINSTSIAIIIFLVFIFSFWF